MFASQWNGTSMLFNMKKNAPHILLHLMPLSHGVVGHMWDFNHWFQYHIAAGNFQGAIFSWNSWLENKP